MFSFHTDSGCLMKIFRPRSRNFQYYIEIYDLVNILGHVLGCAVMNGNSALFQCFGAVGWVRGNVIRPEKPESKSMKPIIMTCF